MDKQQIQDAFIEVLTSDAVIVAVAEKTAEALVKINKSGRNNEEELIKNHIIWAEGDSETGTFMTGPEIVDAINELHESEISVRPRIFRRMLTDNCKLHKDGSGGRRFFVEQIVLEITDQILDAIAETPEPPQPEKKKKKKKKKKGKEILENEDMDTTRVTSDDKIEEVQDNDETVADSVDWEDIPIEDKDSAASLIKKKAKLEKKAKKKKKKKKGK